VNNVQGKVSSVNFIFGQHLCSIAVQIVHFCDAFCYIIALSLPLYFAIVLSVLHAVGNHNMERSAANSRIL